LVHAAALVITQVRVSFVLAILGLAVVGAILHPLAFVIGLMPFETKGLLSVLMQAKNLIADLLAWGLLTVLALMMICVVMGRRRVPNITARLGQAPLGLRRRIAVGIVAYNEAEAIGNVVREFKAQDHVVEVVVVDNNSRDSTAELARAAGARVVFEKKQGYGHACMRALREASAFADAELIVLVEGDGTFAASDLAKFEAYIDQADMVVGTRVVPGLVEEGSQMDYFFTWGNIAVGSLLRLRFWQSKFLGAARLSDVGCTYRMITRGSLERILPDLVVGGHHFSPHMMLVALYRRLSLVEIPISFHRRIGQSKGAGQSIWMGLRVGLQMIAHIITYRPSRREVLPAAKSAPAPVTLGKP
jgi:Glycosyl transferase family 2